MVSKRALNQLTLVGAVTASSRRLFQSAATLSAEVALISVLLKTLKVFYPVSQCMGVPDLVNALHAQYNSDIRNFLSKRGFFYPFTRSTGKCVLWFFVVAVVVVVFVF